MWAAARDVTEAAESGSGEAATAAKLRHQQHHRKGLAITLGAQMLFLPSSAESAVGEEAGVGWRRRRPDLGGGRDSGGGGLEEAAAPGVDSGAGSHRRAEVHDRLTGNL